MRRKISPDQLSLFDPPQRSLFDVAAEVQAPAPVAIPLAGPWCVVAKGTCFPQALRIFCRPSNWGGVWARPNGGRELRVAARFDSPEEAQVIADSHDHYRAHVVPFGPDWMKNDE